MKSLSKDTVSGIFVIIGLLFVVYMSVSLGDISIFSRRRIGESLMLICPASAPVLLRLYPAVGPHHDLEDFRIRHITMDGLGPGALRRYEYLFSRMVVRHSQRAFFRGGICGKRLTAFTATQAEIERVVGGKNDQRIVLDLLGRLSQ